MTDALRAVTDVCNGAARSYNAADQMWSVTIREQAHRRAESPYVDGPG